MAKLTKADIIQTVSDQIGFTKNQSTEVVEILIKQIRPASGGSTWSIRSMSSGGKIPESFLRGCGVPENFIQFMGSLPALIISENFEEEILCELMST